MLGGEADLLMVEQLRTRNVTVLFGDAARPGILEYALVKRTSMLVVATPGAYRTREIVRRA